MPPRRAPRHAQAERALEAVPKQAVRERIWRALEEAGGARFPGAEGRIPNFIGAEAAARLLAEQPEWAAAGALKANPDAPQLPVRVRALTDGWTVYVAVPRLAGDLPFLELDPARLAAAGVTPRQAASIGGSARHGRPVPPSALPHLDLVVCGSVAVDRRGVRVGKGGGYSDLELAVARELGVVDERTIVATTVHPVQLVDEELPETAHDVRLDLVVTPSEVLRFPGNAARRPSGILDGHLDAELAAEIPMLRDRLGRSAPSSP